MDLYIGALLEIDMGMFDNLEEGAKLVESNGNHYSVIFVLRPGLYVMTAGPEKNYHTNVWCSEEMLSIGFKMVEQEPEWPVRGAMFFRLNSQGEIIEAPWTASPKQLKMKEFGNCYRSEAEAMAARERIIQVAGVRKV